MNIPNYSLTDDDVEWLRQVELARQSASLAAPVDPQEVSVNPLLIPSLLTRARLSDATRRAEERRLATLERKRLSLRNRKKRDRRYKTYWEKELTKKKNRRRVYEANGGFGAILRSRGYKQLDQQLWDKHVTELFRAYSPEYLYVKVKNRVPAKVAGKSGYYYGTKEWPITIYAVEVHHKLLDKLFDGTDLWEADNKKAPE